MLDIKFIRENSDLIAAAAKKKLVKFDVKELLTADDKRKEALQGVEKLRAEQNAMIKLPRRRILPSALL